MPDSHFIPLQGELYELGEHYCRRTVNGTDGRRIPIDFIRVSDKALRIGTLTICFSPRREQELRRINRAHTTCSGQASLLQL